MPQSVNRREFLRRALTAGAIGTTAGLTAVATGCGDNPTEPPAPPPTPTGLVVHAVSATSIRLSWTDGSNDETGYDVFRQAATEPDFTRLVSLPANTTEYLDEAVAERTLYGYRIRAVSDHGDSEFSSVASTQTPAADAPAPPAGLAAELVTATSVRLTWQDLADSETGYRIVRLTNGATFQETAPAGATVFVTENLPAGQLHVFSVVAFNEAGDSAPSGAVSVRTGPTAGALSLSVPQPARVALAWQDLSAGASGFRVERKAGGGDFVELSTTAAGATQFLDTTEIPAGVTLVYRVTGIGEIALPAEVTIDAPASPPPVPANVAAENAATDGSHVTVSWDAPDAPETGGVSTGGFQVQRKTEQTAFVDLAVVNSAARSAEDPAAGRTFASLSYRVRAYNLAGFSEFSGSASAVPRAVFPLSTLAALNTIGKSALVTVDVPAIFFSTGFCGTRTRLMVHLVRLSEEEIRGVVANCTHACCTTGYVENASDPAAGQFNCPCHGSQFRMDGTVKQGPAPFPVPTLQALVVGDRVELISDRTIPQ